MTQPYRDDIARDKAALKDGIYYAADGAALPYRSWLPLGKAKAVIVALHGFNDYSSAFDGAGEFFKARGYATYAYDQRGFGAAVQPGVWAGESNLLDDLRQYVRLIGNKYPGRPLYILGESMGGTLTVAALTDRDFPKVDGVILVAPAVWGEDTMNPLFRMTLWLAAHTVPGHTFTGNDLKIQASDNIPLLRRMSRDPLIIKRTRTDAVYGLVQLMDAGYSKVPGVDRPVLMLYGAEDQVIPQEPIDLARKRFTRPIAFAYYPDGYHMLLRDLQGELVMKDIAGWIAHPDRPLPSGFGTSDPVP